MLREPFGCLGYTIRKAKKNIKCEGTSRCCETDIKKGNKFLEVPGGKKFCQKCGTLRLDVELEEKGVIVHVE